MEDYVWGRRRKRRRLEYTTLGEDWGKEDDLGENVEDDSCQDEVKKHGIKVSMEGQDPDKDARDKILHDSRGENQEGHSGGLEDGMVPDQELALCTEKRPGEIIFAPWSTRSYAELSETYENEGDRTFVDSGGVAGRDVRGSGVAPVCTVDHVKTALLAKDRCGDDEDSVPDGWKYGRTGPPIGGNVNCMARTRGKISTKKTFKHTHIPDYFVKVPAHTKRKRMDSGDEGWLLDLTDNWDEWVGGYMTQIETEENEDAAVTVDEHPAMTITEMSGDYHRFRDLRTSSEDEDEELGENDEDSVPDGWKYGRTELSTGAVLEAGAVSKMRGPRLLLAVGDKAGSEEGEGGQSVANNTTPPTYVATNHHTGKAKDGGMKIQDGLTVGADIEAGTTCEAGAVAKMRGQQHVLAVEGKADTKWGKGDQTVANTPPPTYVANNLHTGDAERDDDDLLADLLGRAVFEAGAVAKVRGQELPLAVGGKGGLEEGKGADLVATTHPTSLADNNHPADVVDDGQADRIEKEGGDQPEPCVHDDKGVCHLHGQAQKKLKPRKVWAKGKNGLFGWKYARSTYYVCGMVTKPDPGIPGPTFVSMRNSSRGNENSIASSQGYNSRNVANKRLGDKN